MQYRGPDGAFCNGVDVLRRLLQIGILLFVVVFLGLTVVPLSNRPLIVIQVDQPQRNAFICIFAGMTVGQTFVSKADNLDGVEVFLGPILSENATVIFHVQMGGQDIRTVTVNTSDLVYHQFNRFSFPIISNSSDKKFSFVLASPTSTFNDPLCVSYIDESTLLSPTAYADGSAFMSGTQLAGDLTFRILSEITLAEAFADLYGRASKDALFFAFYLFLLAAIVVILVKVNRSTTLERRINKRASRRNERKNHLLFRFDLIH